MVGTVYAHTHTHTHVQNCDKIRLVFFVLVIRQLLSQLQ